MDYSKKSKYKVIKEGPSPEENDILVSLQALVDRWDENEMSPACEYKDELQDLINDYLQRPLHEIEGRKGERYNYTTKKHEPFQESLPDNVFYKIVSFLVQNHSLTDLELDQEDGSFESRKLGEVTKLFGIPPEYWRGSFASGILSRVYVAAIDNYEGIKNGEITSFEDLTIRPLKKYTAFVSEMWTEHIRYRWKVDVEAYDEHDAAMEIVMNEDGHYDWWEHDHNPEFDKEVGDSDRDGIEVDEIREEQGSNLTEQFIQENISHTAEITKELSALMNYIVKEYSVKEIEEMVFSTPQKVNRKLYQTFKLYGVPYNDFYLPKQLIQFMWDKNLPSDDYSQFIGEDLPLVNQYQITQAYLEWDKTSKDATITLEDTNFESVRCEVQNNFWDYEADTESVEIMDSDYIGQEEFVRVMVNGNIEWTPEQSNPNSKYDPDANLGECENI